MKTEQARALFREIEKAYRGRLPTITQRGALDVLCSARDNAYVTPGEQGWNTEEYFVNGHATEKGVDLIVDNIVSILCFLPQTIENRRVVAWFEKRGLSI